MSISLRLKYIVSLVTPGNRCADIGTDHGFVPACLIKEGISEYVIASDISAGSLKKAEELAKRYDITDRMICRLSDGLENIAPGEVDTLIISGMGGIAMTNILDKKPAVLDMVSELILSPHRDSNLVRDFVIDHGFVILSDETITDKKKDYVIIKAVRQNG